MKRSSIVTTALFLARTVPLPARKIFFRCLLRAFHVLSTKHRMITLSNLSHAFPEKRPAEIIELSRAVYRHLGIITAEIFDIPFLTRENISRFVYPEEFEEVKSRLHPDKGVILITAHFGNWELLAAATGLLVRPVSVIYRPLDNNILDDLVCRIRTATGNLLIPKDRAMRSILRSIKEGAIVGMLIDQNEAWQEGVFVEYFGRPACTTMGMALVANHTGAPVIPLFMAREPSGKYRLIPGEPIEMVNTGDRQEDVFTNMQRVTRVVEECVRRYPDQWLWIHQRWKTKRLQARTRARDLSGDIEEAPPDR